MNSLELFALALLVWLASPALLDFFKWLLVPEKHERDTWKPERFF